MKKRILSVLLALCMCLTFVPVSVFAEDLQQDNSISVLSITPDEGTYRTYVFKANGETISTQIVKNGDTLLEPQVPAQDGKVFTGWSPEVTFGTVSNVDKTETITVNAQFEDGYHVYFKDDNGRIIATKTVANGTKVTFEDVNFPVGSDEAITGWYKDADRTEKVDSVTINGADITLYAKVEKGYWLTFESNGGSYVAPAFYANGTTAEAPDKPTKSGYTFDDWYTDEDLKTPASFDSITASTTLYAKWTAGTETKYTVIHFWENANDDGYSFKESETKTGATGDKTNATAKRYPGFTAQTITQQDIKGDGSTIVSVKYKRNVYSVQFYSNSGIFSSSKEYTSLRITAKYGASIGDKWPTYNGSNTWATSDGGSTYQVNIDTMPLNGAKFYGPKTGWGSETAYYYVEVLPGEAGTAHNGVTYKEHHHDTSPGTGYYVTKEDKYNITGFTYKDGTQNGGSYNGAKFYYTRNSYNILFMNNGVKEKTVAKKFEQSIEDAGYTPTAPAGMTDYVFAGWYDNELGEGNAYDFTGKTMPAQTITLYAKWVAPTYTVTVYDVDGSSVLKTFAEVAKNSTISSDGMPIPTLAEGETFLGWVQKDGTPFSFSTKINQNYDLYAKVGNNSRYKVTYHSNTTADATVTDDTMIYAKDVLATVNDNSFSNGDMVFLGWNTKADGTGTTYYPNGTIKVTGNMDLYAQWGRRSSTVTVTYHSNFGTDRTYVTDAEVNNARITVADYTTLGLPARTGYTFAGWNTEADGTGRTFAAGAFARVDVTEPNDLYAQWTPNTDTTYKVEFYYQNDDGSYPSTASKTEPRTGTTDTTVSVTNADKEAKENGKYTFDANNANNILSGPVAADGSLVLKLYFKLNQADVTVNYYWNETTDKVATSKTLSAQTVGTSVTESPIAIEGYTAVSNASQTITIDVSDNVINFYYYKNVELTANSKTETYDGTEKSVSGFIGAPEGADFSAITVGAKGTNVDTYPASFAEGTVGTVDANKKYIVTEANNGQLTITANATAIVVKIKGNTLTKTYDGNEYTVEGYDVVSISDTRYTATDFSFNGTAEAKGTNVRVGGYSMGLTAAQFTNTSKNFSNVKFEVTDGKLTINPRKVTLTSESGEKEYDGTPLTKPNVTVGGDGFVTGEVTDIKATGSVTYVSDGEVTNTITYTTGEKFNADNYNISKSEGKLKITDRTAKYAITVKANSGEKIYDGTALNVSGFENLEFTVNGQKYTVSGLTASKTGTNVSDSGAVVVEGTAVVKDANGIDVTSQFNVNTEDGQLTINPRKVTLTSGSASKEYDGTPLTNKTVSVTSGSFADGEGATYDVTGTITNVADNKPNNNTFTYTLNKGTTAGNYVIEIMYGTLEITPVAAEVTVEIKGHTTDAIYDATEKTAEGYDVISISNKLYTANDFALTGKDKVTGTAAGQYDMALAFKNISENFSKVTFVVEDGKLTIAKRDVTVTGESATKVYNGQTQEINGYTVDNLVKGHEMTGVIYSAKGKDPGKYDGSFTGSQIVIKDADGNYVTANYNVKTVIGALTITQPSRPTRPSTPTKDVTSVKTADGSQMTLWMSMMLASAAGIVFLGKKRKEEQ